MLVPGVTCLTIIGSIYLKLLRNNRLWALALAKFKEDYHTSSLIRSNANFISLKGEPLFYFYSDPNSTVLGAGGLVQTGPLTRFFMSGAREHGNIEALQVFPLAQMHNYIILPSIYDKLTYPRETYM